DDVETKRYIGVDLHRTCFTACVRLENRREYLKQWQLEDLSKFATKLRPTDQIAVEVTGNKRRFHDAVSAHVERVVAVNPNRFKVITHSMKIRRILMMHTTWRYICRRIFCRRSG